jgi:hypothetical protein
MPVEERRRSRRRQSRNGWLATIALIRRFAPTSPLAGEVKTSRFPPKREVKAFALPPEGRGRAEGAGKGTLAKRNTHSKSARSAPTVHETQAACFGIDVFVCVSLL